MARPALVLLVHRIPYPPNKGDKIRSYHLLRFLSASYDVHLGTFVDDEDDWKYVELLESLCADVKAVRLDPGVQRLLSLRGIVNGEPLSLPYYRSAELEHWVRQKVYELGARRVVAFSSPMAQYIPSNGVEVRKVVDFVDVDSEKWREYAVRRAWPWSWVYAREGKLLLEFEKRVASEASASVFVTGDEAELFRRVAGASSTSVHAIVNGVDTDYFDPQGCFESPYGEEAPVVVFTGMMSYWANVDAVDWFAREIFPLVREEAPSARFVIVGSKPTAQVRALAALGGVEVTGTVPDVRPYLAHASVAVAPMRVARGIQNKVLEALAMGRPVVASSPAVEGLGLPRELRENVSDDARDFAARTAALLKDAGTCGAEGRQWVRAHHDWSTTLAPMAELIEAGI